MYKKNKRIFEKAQKKWKQKKYKKSFNLYLKCSINGYIPAYGELAYMYDDGMGTKMNKSKALYWYKKAEKEGEHWHLNIANIYAYGKYTNSNKEKYWLKKGIKRNDSSAMYNLAIYYRQRNRMSKMEKWFIKSFKHNDGSAAFQLAKIYLSKGRISKAIKYLKITIKHPNKTLYEKEKSQLYLKRITKFKESK